MKSHLPVLSAEKRAARCPSEHKVCWGVWETSTVALNLSTNWITKTVSENKIQPIDIRTQQRFPVLKILRTELKGALALQLRVSGCRPLGDHPCGRWHHASPEPTSHSTPRAPLPASEDLEKHVLKERLSREIQRIQLCCCPTDTLPREWQGEAMPKKTRGHHRPCPSTWRAARGKRAPSFSAELSQQAQHTAKKLTFF